MLNKPDTFARLAQAKAKVERGVYLDKPGRYLLTVERLLHIVSDHNGETFVMEHEVTKASPAVDGTGTEIPCEPVGSQRNIVINISDPRQATYRERDVMAYYSKLLDRPVAEAALMIKPLIDSGEGRGMQIRCNVYLNNKGFRERAFQTVAQTEDEIKAERHRLDAKL